MVLLLVRRRGRDGVDAVAARRQVALLTGPGSLPARLGTRLGSPGHTWSASSTGRGGPSRGSHGLNPVRRTVAGAGERDVPLDLEPGADGVETYLNLLNRELLARLQAGGEVYVSNAVVDGAYLLRACIANFRTTEADIAALPSIVLRVGAAVDAALRPPRWTASR